MVYSSLLLGAAALASSTMTLASPINQGPAATAALQNALDEARQERQSLKMAARAEAIAPSVSVGLGMAAPLHAFGFFKHKGMLGGGGLGDNNGNSNNGNNNGNNNNNNNNGNNGDNSDNGGGMMPGYPGGIGGNGNGNTGSGNTGSGNTGNGNTGIVSCQPGTVGCVTLGPNMGCVAGTPGCGSVGCSGNPNDPNCSTTTPNNGSGSGNGSNNNGGGSSGNGSNNNGGGSSGNGSNNNGSGSSGNGSNNGSSGNNGSNNGNNNNGNNNGNNNNNVNKQSTTILLFPSQGGSGASFTSVVWGPAPTEVQVPGNTVTLPGTTVTMQSSANSVVTVTQSGTTVVQPGITVTQPAITVTLPGSTVTKEGVTVTKEGVTVTQEGTTVTQQGMTVTQPGTTVVESGTTVTQPGTTVVQPGTTVTQPGTTQTEYISCGENCHYGPETSGGTNQSELTSESTSQNTVTSEMSSQSNTAGSSGEMSTFTTNHSEESTYTSTYTSAGTTNSNGFVYPSGVTPVPCGNDNPSGTCWIAIPTGSDNNSGENSTGNGNGNNGSNNGNNGSNNGNNGSNNGNNGTGNNGSNNGNNGSNNGNNGNGSGNTVTITQSCSPNTLTITETVTNTVTQTVCGTNCVSGGINQQTNGGMPNGNGGMPTGNTASTSVSVTINGPGSVTAVATASETAAAYSPNAPVSGVAFSSVVFPTDSPVVLPTNNNDQPWISNSPAATGMPNVSSGSGSDAGSGSGADSSSGSGTDSSSGSDSGSDSSKPFLTVSPIDVPNGGGYAMAIETPAIGKRADMLAADRASRIAVINRILAGQNGGMGAGDFPYAPATTLDSFSAAISTSASPSRTTHHSGLIQNGAGILTSAIEIGASAVSSALDAGYTVISQGAGIGMSAVSSAVGVGETAVSGGVSAVSSIFSDNAQGISQGISSALSGIVPNGRTTTKYVTKPASATPSIPANAQVLTLHPIELGDDSFISRVATGVNTVVGTPVAGTPVASSFYKRSMPTELSKPEIEELFVAYAGGLQKRDQVFDEKKFKDYIRPIVEFAYKNGVQADAKYVQNGKFDAKQAAKDLASQVQNGESMLQLAGRFLGGDTQNKINTIVKLIDDFSNGSLSKRDNVLAGLERGVGITLLEKRAVLLGQLGAPALQNMKIEDIPSYDKFLSELMVSVQGELSKRAFDPAGFAKNAEPYLKYAYDQFSDYVKTQTVDGKFNSDKAAESITKFVKLAVPLLKQTGVVSHVVGHESMKLESEQFSSVSNIILNTVQSFSGAK